MVDRQKVIKGLELCREGRCHSGCPYNDITVGCRKKLDADAISLLKEQEAEIEHLKRPDCEHAEHDGIGCLGYCGCTQDDEPIESCKRCEKYTGNVYEEMKRDENP